jgi:hypothetical protein
LLSMILKMIDSVRGGLYGVAYLCCDNTLFSICIVLIVVFLTTLVR